MFEDTSPSNLDSLYLSNSLTAAISWDEQLPFTPDAPDRGNSLPNRLSAVAEELVARAVRPEIIAKLTHQPDLWNQLNELETLLAMISARDIVDLSDRFMIWCSIDFQNFFSKWRRQDAETFFDETFFGFAEHLCKLGVHTGTKEAGSTWTQHRPTHLEVTGLAVLSSAMEVCSIADEKFKDHIRNKRTTKSFYLGNKFFDMLNAYYMRDSRDEWFFYRLQECWQLFHYLHSRISDEKSLSRERVRLASVPKLKYNYPRAS